MMTDKGSALDGFFAHYDGSGNASAVITEEVTCHTTVDYELVRKYQQHGGGICRGRPLGRLPELWPFDMLKRPLVQEAQRFVDQVKTQGFEPLTSIYEFEVWGPYTEKVGDPQDWTPEADNPFVDEPKTATTAWLYQDGVHNVEKGCAYLIRGRFSRAAKYGHVEEETGIIII
jgi:hypothetical protein